MVARAWGVGLGLSLVLGVVPLVSGLHSSRLFFAERAGKPEVEQLAELKLPWTQPGFLELVRALDEVLPAGAALLCTPVGGDDKSGKSRWFLFLADALYPRRVFVRQPRFASGTLTDYPKWVNHHFELLDTDESGLGIAGILRREKTEAAEAAALAERGVEWELRFELDPKQPFERVELLHAGVVVELPLGREVGP